MGNDAREGVFAHAAVAFVQRDLQTLLRLVRDDVELTLAGSSPIAGLHRGPKAVSRFVMQLRRYVSCTGAPIRFSHGWDRMTAHRDVMVISHTHRVGITLHLTFSFDRSGKVGSVLIEPSDPGLFDHVIGTDLAEHDPKPVRIPELTQGPRTADPSDTSGRATAGRRRRPT
jgi:hypothetical protein